MVAEVDALGAGHFGGGRLFGAANLGQPLGGHARLMAANVAVGDDDVDDATAGARPAGGRAGHAELNVVGVGEDEHGGLGRIGATHSFSR